MGNDYKNSRRDKRTKEDEERLAKRWVDMQEYNGVTIAEFAKSYGILPGTLRKWVRVYLKFQGGDPNE